MKRNNMLVVAVPRGSELKPLAIRNLPRWVTAGCHGFSITNRRNCSVCAIRKRTAGSTPFRIFFVLVDRACVNDLS